MKTTYKDTVIYNKRGKFVVHFLAFIKPDHAAYGLDAINVAYAAAVEWAKPRGGEKYHNKGFGGGVAFNSLREAWDAIDAAPRNKVSGSVLA